MTDAKVTFSHSGVEFEASGSDIEYEKDIAEMSLEDLTEEVRYFSVHHRRLLQLSLEIERRKNGNKN